MFNRETLLASGKPKTKVVDIPEWGDSVTLRELTAEQVVSLSTVDRTHVGSVHDIIASVVDESGEPMFTEADIPFLKTLGAAGILRLAREINALNGLGQDAEMKAEKN